MGRRFGIALLLAGGLLAARGSADDLERAMELARQTLDCVRRSAPQPVLALVCLTSCSDGPTRTEIIVAVDTNLTVPEQLEQQE